MSIFVVYPRPSSLIKNMMVEDLLIALNQWRFSFTKTIVFCDICKLKKCLKSGRKAKSVIYSFDSLDVLSQLWSSKINQINQLNWNTKQWMVVRNQGSVASLWTISITFWIIKLEFMSRSNYLRVLKRNVRAEGWCKVGSKPVKERCRERNYRKKN